MYKMLIYISGSIYESNTGSLLPNELRKSNMVGYVSGNTIQECEDKFKKMIPEGFVEMKKNAN